MRDYLDGMDAGYDVYRAVQPASRRRGCSPRSARRCSSSPAPAPTAPTPTSCRPSTPPRAREILGPDKLLVPEQVCVLSEDATVAREIARRHTTSYLRLPNYTANLERFGFEPRLRRRWQRSAGRHDLRVGRRRHGAARVQAHLDAGADHVAVQVLVDDRRGLPRREWAELAPALLGAVSDFDDVTALRRRGETTTYDVDLHAGLVDRRQAQRRLPARDPRPCRLRRRRQHHIRWQSLRTTCARRHLALPRFGPRSCATVGASRPRGRRSGRATSLHRRAGHQRRAARRRRRLDGATATGHARPGGLPRGARTRVHGRPVRPCRAAGRSRDRAVPEPDRRADDPLLVPAPRRRRPDVPRCSSQSTPGRRRCSTSRSTAGHRPSS